MEPLVLHTVGMAHATFLVVIVMVVRCIHRSPLLLVLIIYKGCREAPTATGLSPSPTPSSALCAGGISSFTAEECARVGCLPGAGVGTRRMNRRDTSSTSFAAADAVQFHEVDTGNTGNITLGRFIDYMNQPDRKSQLTDTFNL